MNVESEFSGSSAQTKQSAEASLQAEEFYRAFIRQSSEGFWRFEMSEPIPTDLPVEEQISSFFSRAYLAECNDTMARFYGFEKAENITNKRADAFLAEPDTQVESLLRAFIESGYRLTDFESDELERNVGERFFVNNLTGVIEHGHLVRAWGTKRDAATARLTGQAFLESEERRKSSQKVEAIGRLAGGIAHDFNNFLAVIMLHTDMLGLQLSPDSPLRFRVSEIKSVSESAAGMVKQLLAFGRKQALQPHPTVLNQVVREFAKIIRSLLGEDIELEVKLGEDLGVTFVDPNQVTQILMNLAVNSRDAMPKGGLLKIETNNIKLTGQPLKHKIQPDGDYIELCVSDTGIGMDSKTKNRIFEPFFTTKETGKGTGLGLATVYGIVKQSNGFIWVNSKINEGTTFKIHFPRIDQPVKTVKNEDPPVIPGGNETILLVEDGEQVRRAAVEVLSILGYKVFEAANGEQAVAFAETHKGKIHLLLTDVVMPRMNGRELSEKMKVLHPEARILFMSGYDDDLIAHHGILEDNVNLLSKPFTPITLAAKIRSVLEG